MNYSQTRKTLFYSLLSVSASLTTCNYIPDNQNIQPNVILILTDQQTMKAMSAAGNPLVKTPSMDKLAANGIRFTRAYCTAPVCGPSRASLVTGMMPSETGVIYNGDTLLKKISTVGDIFRGEGYETIWAGKWHLPESYPQRSAAKSKHKMIQGFDVLPFWNSEKEHWILGAETDRPLTESVVNFIKNYDKSKPLFLAVSYHNPHDICFHPRKNGWVSKDDSLLEIRFFGFDYKLPDPIGIHPDELENLPPLPENHSIALNEPEFITDKRLRHNTYGLETMLANKYSDKEWKSYLYSYYRLTEMVDIEIGKLLKAIEDSGFNKNTIILFTSDHGDGASAHKWAAKLSLYEESVNVPFIMVYPGHIDPGLVDDTNLVSLADIVPTMCDYAGISTEIPFAGKSLRPLLEKETESIRDYLITELADYKPDTTRIGFMVLSEKFKFTVFSHGKNNRQFFDLASDPGEMNNLAADSSYNQLIRKHEEFLKNWQMQRDFVTHVQ